MATYYADNSSSGPMNPDHPEHIPINPEPGTCRVIAKENVRKWLNAGWSQGADMDYGRKVEMFFERRPADAPVESKPAGKEPEATIYTPEFGSPTVKDVGDQ